MPLTRPSDSSSSGQGRTDEGPPAQSVRRQQPASWTCCSSWPFLRLGQWVRERRESSRLPAIRRRQRKLTLDKNQYNDMNIGEGGGVGGRAAVCRDFTAWTWREGPWNRVMHDVGPEALSTNEPAGFMEKERTDIRRRSEQDWIGSSRRLPGRQQPPLPHAGEDFFSLLLLRKGERMEKWREPTTIQRKEERVREDAVGDIISHRQRTDTCYG